jgi:transposase
MPTREDAAKKIILKGGQIKIENGQAYKVKSQSGNGYYELLSTLDGITCTCPDFVQNRIDCKHILALKMYLENPKENAKAIGIRKTYPQKWPEYNAAQINEIPIFDLLLKGLVETIPEAEQNMGRPRMPLQDSLFCAIKKVYHLRPSRTSCNYYRLAAEREQISHAPHFNAVSKLFNDASITPILQKLVTLSALPVRDLEKDFAIDSTGFRTTKFNAYDGSKYGQKKAHCWIKAHMAIGIKTNIVAGIRITDENGGDSPQFIPLLDDLLKNFKVQEISADRAYSSRDNIDAVCKAGVVCYIPFKKNVTGKSRGSVNWYNMFQYFRLNPDKFMKHYHKRSNAESTNWAIKARLGEPLRSKNFMAQKNESLAKVIAYNITVLNHEMFENGILPDYLTVNSNGPIQSTLAMVGLAKS